MVLSLMAAALCASLLARWLARPLYPALAAAQLAKLHQVRTATDETRPGPVTPAAPGTA